MKLITALLLAIGISVAQAQEYSAATKAGGEVRLTYQPCANNTARPFVAYVRGPDGSAIYGCWAWISDSIHVRFSDGDNRIYDYKLFYEVPGTAPKTKKGTDL